MAASAAAEQPGWTIRVRWQSVFLFFQGFLAATILLKYGPIQYLELIDFGFIVVMCGWFVLHGYRATWFRLLLWLAGGYLLFCAIAMVLALLAPLRFQFYTPRLLLPFKGPVTITIARIVELWLSLAAMFYMARLFGVRIGRARFTMKVYFWTGVVSAVWSLASYPLLAVGFNTGAVYSNLHRVRGFYNEGGPYGLYVMSVVVVGIALGQLGWLPKRRMRFWLGVLGVTFFLCFSKAAFLATITLFLLNALLARSGKQRAVILGSGAVVLCGILYFINLPRALEAYEATAAQYERTSHYHSNDANFIYGRVAGAFIVPRMIAAHPWTGVGWGNYGLLRNAPEYRGAAVYTEFADDPGLGIFGLLAELGFPLLGFLLLCLLTPFFFLRSIKAPVWLTNLALVQPLVHLYGAQLNVTYPWVTTAFALGIGIYVSRHGGFSPDGLAQPLRQPLS